MSKDVTLLASSPTIGGIEKCINQYWFSTDYRVDPQTLAITHPRWSMVDKPVRVIFKRGRYRFERVQP